MTEQAERDSKILEAVQAVRAAHHAMNQAHETWNQAQQVERSAYVATGVAAETLNTARKWLFGLIHESPADPPKDGQEAMEPKA